MNLHSFNIGQKVYIQNYCKGPKESLGSIEKRGVYSYIVRHLNHKQNGAELKVRSTLQHLYWLERIAIIMTAEMVRLLRLSTVTVSRVRIPCTPVSFMFCKVPLNTRIISIFVLKMEGSLIQSRII